MMTAPYGSVRSDTFIDPDQYQAAVRGGDSLFSLLACGSFRADLTEVDLGRVKLQSGRESLPRLSAIGMPPNKLGILAWFGDGRPIVRGIQVQLGEVLSLGLGMESHHRISGPNQFVSVMLDSTDLSQAVDAQSGRDLVIAAGTLIKPSPPVLARLISVIRSALQAGQTTPEIFTSPQAIRALEEALLRALIDCVLPEDRLQHRVPPGRRAELAKKFEEAVEANLDRPLFSLELSRVIGISERSLRKLCQEQLGISPGRFLALRRLHLARQALLRADHHSTTVTHIAMGLGMWELGRFAVAYKAVFGESPSATLRRI